MGPNPEDINNHYQTAMASMHKQLKRPHVQRSVFSMARTTPTDMVRSKLSTAEIQHRAVARLPDELLSNIPEHENSYSLFQGFQASFADAPGGESARVGRHHRRVSRGRKLIDDGNDDGSDDQLGNAFSSADPKRLQQLKKDKASMMHEFEILNVRKNMASAEIREVDNKIANLHGMRRIVLERLAGFEQEEALLEHDCGCQVSPFSTHPPPPC